jgi:hypothetical protein
MNREKLLTIPAPLLVLIEDVGWWNGQDQSFMNQPYRTGMDRRHCPQDYEAVAFLGKKLGTRILTGFVPCEWDSKNLLRKIPTSTWMGTSWDNPYKLNPLLDMAAEAINNNREFIEIAIHGVGHEFWENKVLFRSEFHDTRGHMRERAYIISHFEAFFELLKQSGIETPAPTIFIPPALKHSFGNGENGFRKILSEFGVHFVILQRVFPSYV